MPCFLFASFGKRPVFCAVVRLFVLWCVFCVSSVLLEIRGRKFVISAVFIVASLLSGSMIVLAAYFPKRTAGVIVYFAILSCAILLPDFMRAPFSVPRDVLMRKFARWRQIALASVIALLLFFSGFSMLKGSYHILENYLNYHVRELEILEKIEGGETDIVAPVLHPISKYCANYGLRDLHTNVSDLWPNTSIARYYGVSSIIGEERDE